MHRRAFLGAMGAAAFAGCSDNGEADDAGTPAGDGPTSPAGTPTAAGSPSRTPESGPMPPHKGVSLSPRSFGSGDFATFVEQAAAAGTALRWAGDWAELADPSAAPAVVATIAREHGQVAVIAPGVFSVSRDALFRPLTPETRRSYVDSAVAFAVEHAPAYLGLGVEVNLHHASDPASFEAFVDLFAETQAAVADATPDTQVYVTFQYEHLQGLRGGLFGGENDPADAEWELLDRFPDSALVGLTTYPGLIYRDPADVPGDYFDPIATRANRPVAITETGWTTGTVAPGWESDEAEQAAYVRRLFDLVAPIDLELLLWLWVYEQETAETAFRGMGLRRNDGSPRPAWDAWLDGEL